MTTTISNPPANPIPYTSTFESDMTAWLAWLTANASKFGDLSFEVNSNALIVSNGMPTILNSLNFRGEYSTLIGALAVPASTYYSNAFWQLVAATADVTLDVPGVSEKWKKVVLEAKPTIPTGETIAAGNLLADDDAGNSQSVAAITTAILQAIAATSFHACGLANGNTAIFWTTSSTDYRMMIIDKVGATVLASTSVATGANSGNMFGTELTNGNIVISYTNASQQPVFKVVSQSGTTIVAETIIEAVSLALYPKVSALNGGGFAALYSTSTASKYAVYTNAGAVTKAPTVDTTATINSTGICSTSAGGFAVMRGADSGGNASGAIYNSAGTQTATLAISMPTFSSTIGMSSKSGSVAVAGKATTISTPVIALASDSSGASINSTGSSSSGLAPNFGDMLGTSSTLGLSDLALMGDGNYIATFIPYTTSTEYPRYVIFNEIGQIIRAGICIAEEVYTDTTSMKVIPKDVNGFSLIWRSPNRNIKFAQIKSGNLVGISDGQEAGSTKYNVNGAVTLASGNMLNVGGSKVNYSRQGKRVVI